MGVRSAISGTLTRAAKAVAPASALVTPELSEPQAMADAARDVSQMTMDHAFAPGEPVGPYDGYSRHPRQFDFTTGFNIATRPRTHERVSFDTLKGLIRAYDVADIAIWHRIDSLRSVKYRLTAAEGYTGDITGAVDIAAAVLRKPDRKRNFKNWFAKWMYDVLAYDAGALYRLRNRAGRPIGLMPVDGTLIAPLLDYWGNPPDDPAEAYVQYVNGLPWNWLTRSDLIYEPFRTVNDSIYGRAPIESIILNANTDIRFQLHFLGRFTEGNIPEAFASAPESWDPDAIERFQGYWDSFMYGDQSRKHQIRWMPGGSSISWTNEKDFTDEFSLFMMRKTCAAYHLVPTDLGFTDNANYATGESQADVQHKVGELPLMEYAEEILSQFLYDDLGLPLKFEWDKGEDQDDRLVQAQADDIYIKNGTLGTEETREMRYGLPKSARPVARFIFSERGGPVPLNALMAVAGEIDPETGAPTEAAVLPREAFAPVEGVESNPPLMSPPLAEIEYGPSALPAAGPPQPGAVAKEDGGGAGIDTGTGIYGYDGPGSDDEDEPQAVAKEMAAFRRFARSRQRAGTWRDFRFDAVSAGDARRLNDEGREAVAKAVSAGPKARTPRKHWPGWDHDKRAADYWAPLLAAALAKSLTVSQAQQIAAAYLKAFPGDQQGQGKRVAVEQAAAWLASQGLDLAAVVAGVLPGVTADGWLIGAASAAALASGTRVELGGWKPGDTDKARRRAEALGLGAGFAEAVSGAGQDAERVAGGWLTALGRALADGASGGLTAAAIGASLRSALADTAPALSALLDLLTAAAGAAARSVYLSGQVQMVEWVCESGNPCATCEMNQDQGPIPVDGVFSSGDAAPPVHNHCMCAIAPA